MTGAYSAMTAWIVVTSVSKSSTGRLMETFMTQVSGTIRNRPVPTTIGAHRSLKVSTSPSLPGAHRFRRAAAGGCAVALPIAAEVLAPRLTRHGGRDRVRGRAGVFGPGRREPVHTSPSSRARRTASLRRFTPSFR